VTEPQRRRGGFLRTGETWRDDVTGALIAGVAVVLAFRFLFGDPWPFAIGGGVFVFAASMLLGVWTRRRRNAV